MTPHRAGSGNGAMADDAMDADGQGTVFVGIGGCGIGMLRSWMSRLPDRVASIAVDRDDRSIVSSTGFDRDILLSSVKAHGSSFEYADAARVEVARAIENQWTQIEASLDNASSVVLLAGLGGVVGSGGAVEVGCRLVERRFDVTAMLVMPFAFEGDRVKMARAALAAMPAFSRQILCHNDYLIRHAPKGASMNEAFDVMNDRAWDLLFGGSAGYQTHVTS